MAGQYILHGAQRSSAAWRARIALNLKGVNFREIRRDLNKGEQGLDDYRAINPQMLVPSLECPNGAVLHQSLAIIDYLDEIVPRPAFLPATPEGRARVRAMAQMIACDIHPINNLRVREHVKALLPGDPDAMAKWQAKWASAGFEAIEAMLAREPAQAFAFGDAPGYFECFLVPQVGNQRSSGRSMAPYPILARIADNCARLPAFAQSNPANLG